MKKRFLKGLKEDHFRVSIFGSARINKNDAIYKQIYKLGKVLGERNIDIVTGGGPGLMEAANAGHGIGSEKTGAHSIGLNIKLPREQIANKHLDLKAEFAVFSDRLDEFMRLSNVIVVAPGGVGTLLELFYTWQLVQVEHMKSIPIILLGEMWEGLGEWLRRGPMKRGYFERDELKLLFFTRNFEEVVEIIDEAFGQHMKKKGKKFRFDYKKYRSP